MYCVLVSVHVDYRTKFVTCMALQTTVAGVVEEYFISRVFLV